MNGSRNSTGLIFSIVLLVVIGGVLFVPSVTAAFKFLQEGMTAPSVVGRDIITGDEIQSDNFSKSNIVVITFWATWSKRSLEELADLKAIAEKYRDKPVRIIAVNVENQKISPATETLIKKTADDMKLSYPVIIDRDLATFYNFGVIAVPSTAILDTSGILRYAPSGYSLTTKDLIEDTIEVLLGLKKPTAESVVAEGYVPQKKSARYYNLALQLANQRMYDRALSDLDLAQQADIAFSAPHNLRGQIYLDIEKTKEAVGEFEISVRLDTSSVAARAGLGRALLRDGQADSAFVILSQTLTMDSTYTPAVLDMALCLSEEGKTEEALKHLLAARDLDPRNPSVHYYLGRVYLNAGRKGEAADEFRAALEIIYPAP